MDPGEKESWMKRDPFPRYRAWLIEQKHAAEAELAAIEAGIEKELDAAVAFAVESAFPEVAELRRDVYREELPA